MSSDPSPVSLRETYSKPSTSWNFTPQAVSSSQTTSSSAASMSSSTAFTPTATVSSTTSNVNKFQWGSSAASSSGAPSSSFVGATPGSFAGSTYASGSYPYGTAVYGANMYGSGYGPGYGYGDASRVALKALLASAFLQYTTTAIAMPWEVGKVLLQVQWVPKSLDLHPQLLDAEEDDEEHDENDELSDSSTDDSYFLDPTVASPSRKSGQARAKPVLLVRKSSHKPTSNASPLIIAYGPADGVWGMVKRVGRSRTEGWGSLWKGLLTSVTLSLLTSTVQPSVSSFLRPIVPSSRAPLLLPLISHVITGLILSPLDTIRTLQIIHPRPSPSPFTHLSLLFSKDSEFPITLSVLYTHPTLLFPALLDNTIRPLVTLLMPRIIESMTGVRIGVNVWTYPICEFIGGVLGLAITIPIETIRRRLQAQIVVHGLADPSRSSGESTSASSKGNSTRHVVIEDLERVPSCVHLSPKPYSGMWDCFWRILWEERSGPPPKRHRRRSAPAPKLPPVTSPISTPKASKDKGKGRGRPTHGPRLSGGGRRGDVRNVFEDQGPSLTNLAQELRESQAQSDVKVPGEPRTPGKSRPGQAHGPPPMATRSSQLGEKFAAGIEEVQGEISEHGVDGWLANTGIGQLYRGYGMGVGALALVLVLGLITGSDDDGGWAEL